MRKLGRIAIWNKTKVIIVIAMGIWAADVSFFIYSKNFLLTMHGIISYNSGMSQVSYG